MITIRIDTDNDAFNYDLPGEVKRILNTVKGYTYQPLVDINGNIVGKVNIGEDN